MAGFPFRGLNRRRSAEAAYANITSASTGAADPPAASSSSRRGSSQFKNRFLKPGPPPTNELTGTALLPGETVAVSVGTPYNPIAIGVGHDDDDILQQGIASVDSADTQMLIERQQREEKGMYGPVDPVGSTASTSQFDHNNEEEGRENSFYPASNMYDANNTGGSGLGDVGEENDDYDHNTTDHLRDHETFSSAGEDAHHYFLGNVNSTEERQTSVHLHEPIDSDDFYDEDGEPASSYFDHYEGAEGREEDDEQAFTFCSGDEEEDETQFVAPSDMKHESYYRHYYDHHGGRGLAVNGNDDGEQEETTYADDTYDCSKTLNTNDETLHTNLEGVNYIPVSGLDQQHLLLGYDDDFDENSASFDEENFHRDSLEHIGSYLYEDDGHVHYEDVDGNLHELLMDEGPSVEISSSGEGTFITGADEDGNTFQETLTTDFEQSLHSDNHNRIVNEMTGTYFSEQSSECSWEEGSFAGGASRTISRVDSVDEDDDEDEDDDGEETFYESGDDTANNTRRRRSSIVEDRTWMGLFKKFRDFNMADDFDDDSDSEYDDDESCYDDKEDEYAVPDVALTESSKSNSQRTRESIGSYSRSDRKKCRSSGAKGGHRRQKTPEIGEMINRIGSMSMDFLHDAIDKQQTSKSMKSRRRSKNKRDDRTSQILDSFQTIFSCGVPPHR